MGGGEDWKKENSQVLSVLENSGRDVDSALGNSIATGSKRSLSVILS